MCGRYAASANPDELIEAFEVELDATDEPSRSVLVNPQDPPVGSPDYNMAPSKQAAVVLSRRPRGPEGQQQPDAEPVRRLRHLTWGLVPSWAKDRKIGMRMTNARAETLLDKPAFARAAQARRAIIPAAGWYEWQVSPVAKDSATNTINTTDLQTSAHDSQPKKRRRKKKHGKHHKFTDGDGATEDQPLLH